MSFRVLLIYPPTSESELPAAATAGLDADRHFMPYGVMTTAACLREGGFDVNVLNLCTSDWPQALSAIESRPADLIGISCYTFHRHAAAALGTWIKVIFPEAHLTVGGPHVWALAPQWLHHHRAFDSVVIGEGEATALELARALRDGRSTQGIPGTAYRERGRPAIGPPREFIADLDGLGKPWRYFDYGFLVTSRGCPGKCTFCCSPELWGRKIRFRSAENVLEEIEELVAGRGHRFLNVKDDTFTARKSRVLEICRKIDERGLVFRWVCDTRVDCADGEVLAAMRRAGCVRVNLGIESGSPEVLRKIGKPIDPDRAMRVTAEARDLGMDVRYYLIVGNQGDTPHTIYQTLDFVEKARPTHFLLHTMAVFPGTADFRVARSAGLISEEDYFDRSKLTGDFVSLGEDSPEMTQVMGHVIRKLGADEQAHAPFTLAEREEILRRHPDMLRSYTDLALAYAGQWRLDEADQVLAGAAQMMGGQVPELLHYAACIKFARRDFAGAGEYFERVLEGGPNDTSVILSRKTIQEAGRLDYRKQGEVAMRLLTDLQSRQFLFLGDGVREVPSLGPEAAG